VSTRRAPPSDAEPERRRRSAHVAALTMRAPGVRPSGLAAGFQAVAHLPPGVDQACVVDWAWEREVAVYGMPNQAELRLPVPVRTGRAIGLDEICGVAGTVRPC
jgi:hypothetical protein